MHDWNIWNNKINWINQVIQIELNQKILNKFDKLNQVNLIKKIEINKMIREMINKR